MSSLTLRRSLVVLATVASIFGGAVAIRAAAGWTASSAPLTAPPDPASLVTRLQNEQARADAITQELTQVVDRAAELQSALDAAQAKAMADAKTAKGLAGQLAAAQKRLAALEKQMGVTGSTGAPAGAAATAQPTEPAHGDDD